MDVFERRFCRLSSSFTTLKFYIVKLSWEKWKHGESQLSWWTVELLHSHSWLLSCDIWWWDQVLPVQSGGFCSSGVSGSPWVPKLIWKEVIYAPFWAKIFTVAAKLRALRVLTTSFQNNLGWRHFCGWFLNKSGATWLSISMEGEDDDHIFIFLVELIF